MQRMITSPAHAIELLGGSRAVAGRISRPLTTVSSWASRQSIPVDVWALLIEFAREKAVDGFDYETLTRAHAGAVTKLPRSKRAA